MLLQEKKDKLKEFKREVDYQDFLFDLLKRTGYEDLRITHQKGSTPELGKDLVGSRLDTIEETKEWTVFVVKIGKVSGRSGITKAIVNQVEEAFDYVYKDAVRKLHAPINKVKAVTNDSFSEGSKDTIQRTPSLQAANVSIWDSDKIIDLIDRYYSTWWLGGNVKYQEYVASLLERMTTNSAINQITKSKDKSAQYLKNFINPIIKQRFTAPDGRIKYTSKTIDSIAANGNNILLTGAAGSGKTTILGKVITSIIENNALRKNESYYPFFITFNDLRNHLYDIIETIKSSLKLPWATGVTIDVDEIVKSGMCTIIIDALDELALEDTKKEALHNVNKFNQSYESIRIICSSRDDDFLFHECEKIGFEFAIIANLNIAQAEQYIQSYYGDGSGKSEQLVKYVKASGVLSQLPITPLTVTLLTLVFEEHSVESIATLYDLYELFCDQLLGKYYAKDRLGVIEYNVKKRLVCEIAYHMHTENTQRLSSDELGEVIETYSKARRLSIDYDIFISEVCSNSGVLSINGEGFVEFSHMSFQEYYAAHAIYHFYRSDKDLLVESFPILWWQNVAIFYAGIVKDDASLIIDISKLDIGPDISRLTTYSLGLGFLLQTLYNTKVEARVVGLRSSVRAMTRVVQEILDGEDNNQTQFFRSFPLYHWSYVLARMFAYHHKSVMMEDVFVQTYDEVADELNSIMEVEKLTGDTSVISAKTVAIGGPLAREALMLALSLSIDEYKRYEFLVSVLDYTVLLNDEDIAIISDVNDRIRKINERSSPQWSSIKKIDRVINREIKNRGLSSDKLNTAIRNRLK